MVLGHCLDMIASMNIVGAITSPTRALADRDCYLINRQLANASLECLVIDVYSNKARR
jgi:hypothetical protein